MAQSKSDVESPDFSQPWKLSDVVLVVEEEKFYVHRAILAFWSPVFEKMFTSEFQEKKKNEIRLPGKKASEIREFLLHIYPSVKEKAITAENCYFLLKLAHEYQMAAIVERCEDFMVDKVKIKPKDSIISDLVFAQTYKLEKLKLASVQRSHSLGLEELKNDKMYEQVQPENLKGIMEGIIVRLQRELQEAQSVSQSRQMTIQDMKRVNNSVRNNGLCHLENIAKLLVNHASNKGIYSLVNCFDTDSYLAALSQDRCGKSVTCSALCGTVCYLRSLKQSLESLK